MQTINDVHHQFAAFFQSDRLKPFAYLVSKRLAEGHICINLNEPGLLPEESLQLEKYKRPLNTNGLEKESLVSTEGAEKQPFILHNQRLYLQRYFNYESSIVQSIKNFISTESTTFDQRLQILNRHRTFISALSAPVDNILLPAEEQTDWQQAAAIMGVLNNFTIITGGPGTGKTTTVAKILAILYTIQPTLRVALAAPTGKAAVRMAESLKTSAINVPDAIKDQFKKLVPGTIHRLLKYQPGSPYFRHDQSNPLAYDLVVVDEASMIDVALFAKLLAAIGPHTRIILLGDKDQLASVEAGSLLGDLCQTQPTMNAMPAKYVELINDLIPGAAGKIGSDFIATGHHPLSNHIIGLKRSHRFSGEGGIGKFSRAILHGRLEEIAGFIDSGGDEQVRVDTIYDEAVFNRFIAGYSSYIAETDIAAALHQLNQLRVLCAVREGIHGINAVNRRIESWLAKKGLVQTNTEWYLNRPVIVTRNYPELKLFNGDVGIIRPDASGSLKAWFEDSDKNLRAVLPGYLTSAETVYAMTIHKSQGSEYPGVLVILPDNAEHPLLTRELLYTAITRAKNKVYLQAPGAVILYTSKRSVQRASGIMERFE